MHASHSCESLLQAGFDVSVHPLLTSDVPVIEPVMHPLQFPLLKHFNVTVWPLTVLVVGQKPVDEPSPAELSSDKSW